MKLASNESHCLWNYLPMLYLVGACLVTKACPFLSSMHCFEGPEWFHLKRGRESFARGPLVKVDPQGRCGGVLVYGLQMIILKAAQVSFTFYTTMFVTSYYETVLSF